MTATRGDNAYCPMEDLKAAVDLTASDDADDVLLGGYCVIASRMIDGECKRKFYPALETYYYDHPADPGVLRVDGDLLAVTTFTTQNGEVTVGSDDYYLMCGGSYNYTPYNRIVMIPDGDYPNLLYSGRLQKANALTATWGYHEDWANAWQDSNDTVQNAGGITAAGTSITVSDADGANLDGETPRFKAQQLIKVGDEYMHVTDRNDTTNAITVRRGVNGTTAAAHDADTTIYIYRPMAVVYEAARQLAKWLYNIRDASIELMAGAVDQGGTIRLPPNAPSFVKGVCEIYKDRRFG